MAQGRRFVATALVGLLACALPIGCGLSSADSAATSTGGSVVTGATASAGSSGGDTSTGGGHGSGGHSHVGGGEGGGSGGAPPACTGLSGMPGDFDLHLTVGSDDRRYLLHVPAHYDPTQATRLIIALHGFSDGPEDMRDITHFNDEADTRSFLVAYPEGLNASWNGGTCCGLSMITGVDDVGFISALIDAIAADYCVDPARVHATGFSNGGFMAHRLGCELSDRVASIAVVAGQESLSSCNPTRPVPVLQIHGNADPVVPYDGNPLLGFPSTASTVTGWAQRDGCPSAATPLGQIGDTSCEQYAPCHQGSAVELCTVDGGGHDWPGGGSLWVNGMPPSGFVATFAVLDFFEAHPRP